MNKSLRYYALLLLKKSYVYLLTVEPSNLVFLTLLIHK